MPPLTQTDANNMSLKDLSVAMAGNNEGQQKPSDRAREYLASRGVTSPEPTVSAQQLAEPPQQVTVPEIPEAPGISPATNAGIRSTFLDLQRTAQGARQLQQRQQELADLGAVSSFDLSQQLEREYGVTPERLGQLERLENELAAMDAESAERKARRLTAPGGTAAGARAAISREDVELAVRSANTAAQAEVLRGNIDLARERVRDAVTLATQDRQFQSNLLINQINQLQGQVDSETQAALDDEKRQFEASQARIEEIKTAVDAAIASGATSQQEMAALTAISQPQQPNETVQQYLDRMEREDASKLALAQSIVGRGATQDRDLTRQQQLASIRSSNASAARAETGRLLDLAEAGNVEAAAELGITLDDGTEADMTALAFAQEYASTGKIPTGLSSAGVSFGDVSELAKQLPKQDGTVVSTVTGVPDSSVSSTLIDGYSIIADIIDKSEQLAQLNEERAKSGFGARGARLFGSDRQQQFLDLRQEIVDLLSRARTGAALTKDEEDFYNSQLPGLVAEPFAGAFSVDTTARIRENFGGKLKDTLQSKLDAQGLTMYGFSEHELGGTTYKVGERIVNEYGQVGIVNPDGTLTVVNQ